MLEHQCRSNALRPLCMIFAMCDFVQIDPTISSIRVTLTNVRCRASSSQHVMYL